MGIQSPSPWSFTLLLSYTCSIITDRSSVDPGTYIYSTRRVTDRWALDRRGAHTHARMHTCRQAGRHIHMQARTHASTQACTLTSTQGRTHINTHTHARTHARMHAHARTHARCKPHVYTNINLHGLQDQSGFLTNTL